MTKQTVWVVELRAGGEWFTDGIFSTQAKADAALRAIQTNMDIRVVPWVVDKEVFPE